MSGRPAMPGVRVDPETAHHWTTGQIIESHDLVRSAALIGVGLLALVLAVIVITGLWR